MDLRALVVSSDQKSADLLKQILPELGMVADHTMSTDEALARLDQERFEAIILDYRGDRDSENFLRSLRHSTKNRAGVLIAIVDSDFNARPLFGLGANFILYRPLSSERTRISLRAARGLIRRERRRAPRVSVNATVNVAYPGAPELKAMLQDLSIDGTSLTTAKAIPPQCKVYFDFSLPGQEQLVRLSGEVAWQDASGRTGIRFLDVPQSSRRLMQGWLQQNKAPLVQPTYGKGAADKSLETRSDGVSAGAENKAKVDSKVDSNPELKPAKPNLISNAGNRRDQLRVGCKLGAEVYRVGSRVPHRCVLSDMSEGGCYVEMPTPFVGQSSVEILVRTEDEKVRISGRVLATHPGFGMGVRFNFRDSAEKEDILRLLAELASSPEVDKFVR
jgi:CheY-like chemotaxis protein